MTTKQIAEKLVQYCREGEFVKAQKELYAKDAVSIEPEAFGDYDKETKGLDKINKKITKWMDSVETMNKMEVSEPIVAENSFVCSMHMDLKMKNKPERMDTTELCLYQVKDGKIISEEFFV